MTYTPGKALTDRTGLFAIEGIRGFGIRVKRLSKIGYAPVALEERNYTYAQLSTQGGEIYQPDPSSPVIYKMWRLEDPQDLLSFEYATDIPTDGTLHRSSSGNGILEGVFRLRFERGDITNAEKTLYDWTLTLELERGVVQRNVDEFMFLAPADGYHQRLELAMKTANPHWQQKASLPFFARTSSGKYGRFVLHVTGPLFGDEPRARVTIEGAVNPTGSRNLESGRAPRSTSPSRN